MDAREIPVEMLPEIYQDIAGMIGIDATIMLGREFGGMNLYLPKMETALRPWRDELMRAEFNGANITALARKYRLTSTRVRQILELSGEK